MNDLSQDIRYAMRAMLRNPGFTATVVLVLALGIGANSALFGIVDAALLRPLPYPESQRIVSVSMTSENGSDVGRIDDRSAQILAGASLRTFDAVAASNGTGANLTGGDIPVLAGRGFTDEDETGSEPVTIISESLARAAFSGRSAVGERLDVGGDESYTVIGVVADARQIPGRTTPYPAMYQPNRRSDPLSYGQISLRVSGGSDPLTVLPALRAALRTIDPSQPLSRVTTMDALFSESMAPRQFNLLLLGSFAALACVLAAVGLYGVISFLVAQRTREIGLRMALGAEASRVVRAVLREGMVVTLAGIAVGITGSLALSRIMEGMLFQVDSKDPIVFVAVPLLLLAVAALAITMPARRASRVDPATALRAE